MSPPGEYRTTPRSPSKYLHLREEREYMSHSRRPSVSITGLQTGRPSLATSTCTGPHDMPLSSEMLQYRLCSMLPSKWRLEP
eukprot:CAMPEP_0117666320 /NCGR_PEP_ID=MMETSP0804-20121206/10308_1 /TAXON_ID=1074897 /ORGANISM="Tetraselmis astigmatica, Strain CCMP880" /LENGTH=81 /DNA_ID=CAMNT_0005473847 /DNA_START=1125 /DNA_END=1370 /DNA_ORIENTATION=-